MTIKSSYSIATIPSSYYQTVTISGSTLIGTKGGLDQGYIFVPYLIVDKKPIILDSYWKTQMLREERIEKLNKLKDKYDC